MKGITRPDKRKRIIEFTRDISLASGDQAVTGVGFRPSKILFIGAVGTMSNTVGIDDGTIAFAICGADSGAVLDWSTYSIYVRISSGNQYEGKITSFDADGFTITWVKQGLPTGTANIKALCWE